MQNRRILISLIVASVIGLLALFIAAFVVKDEQAVKSAMVVSADESIPMGTPISGSQLKLIKVPGDTVPAGIFHTIEELIGRIPKGDIKAGEVVFDRMLYSANSSSGLAFAISAGKRAMSMNVNEVSDVAGFVTPGSFVDVLFSSKDETGRYSSRIILQRVLVLAVAQDRVAVEDTKPRLANSVTLEVTPQQAEVLDAARLAGNLSLVLRNQTEGSTPSEMTQTHSSSENGVEVIRGTSVRMESGLGR
ncbi:Flp pilus assembly protein CpaB [Polynucleobacter sp. AP-Reno-20A-A9]|uniref:Flp pilus assembly protein CpaB n=1 Tax=Polynucleobacter sp. AP-Reno-20A-A9 TaxID=2576925 RepID=UPI001C0CD34B|nr:Flp pilus assembly protein CpaB [Polynucleobacter sp. AP-Reno-20A-A9]MBU3628864.1 Flp pilus assembly protein CpaB [Polynucleobacter sp. AP-Reno-20A-A9]